MEPSKFFLHGEIDVASAGGLVTTLRSVAAIQSGPLLIDCGDLTFIDAAGIGALIVVHQELARDGRDLCLVYPSPFFRRLLDILDLTRLRTPGPSGVTCS